MAQMTGSLNKDQNLKPQFANSIPVEITRVFRAPIERVWAAFSEIDLLKQWWGPETYSCPEAQLDFREGGQYNFAMQSPDQKMSWSGGKILEIVPNQKLVYTDHFTDQKGNAVEAKEYNMPGEWPEDLYVTIHFEKLGDQETTIKLVHEGIPKEMHDDCVQGWNSSLDKLQRLVEHA
jgi:uncharacterized protein YndB with AHSA1/START domain